MTRAKDISKIVTDADLSGTLDVAGLLTTSDITLSDNSPTIIFDDANGVDQNFTFAVNGGTANIQSRTDAGVNTTRFTVSSNGNIDFKGGDISFYEDTGTTAKLFWDASEERLGIGTSSPASSLHIQSSTPILRLTDSDTAASHELSGQSGAGNLNIKVDTGGTSGSPVFNISMQDSTKVSVLNNGNVGIGTTSPTGKFQVDGGRSYFSSNSDAFALYLRYNTSTGGVFVGSPATDTFTVSRSGGQEHFRIDSSGNVGIGTSSPSSYYSTELVVATSDNGGITLANSNTTHSSYIMFADGTSGSDRIRGQFGYDHNLNSMAFHTNLSERMRIDSSGNLLVGKTSSSLATNGSELLSNGTSFFTRSLPSGDGAGVAYFQRNTSDGNILMLYNSSASNVGSIGTTNGDLTIGTGDTGLRFHDGDNRIYTVHSTTGAKLDGAIDLGEPAGRWEDIYATNGTIQTSDRNEKQDIEELSEAEQRVATACKGLLRKWKWKSAVAEKGDNARTHFGIIAQDLQDAFTAEGLDAGDYAMFMSNTWWQKEISVDAVEADEENGIEAKDAYTYIDTKEEATEGYTEKTRLGVRYSELLAFIISAI
jgi:hypothetical protein